MYATLATEHMGNETEHMGNETENMGNIEWNTMRCGVTVSIRWISHKIVFLFSGIYYFSSNIV